MNPGDKTVLNLAYDGIYTSKGDLFSGVINNYTKILKNYLLAKTKSSLILSKIGGGGFTQGEIYTIYNTNGQLVLRDKLIKLQGVIDISTLNNGVYYLEIIKSEKIIERIKFVHLY
ncbi:MAG: T9SS type A sorting domain-containing protein [Saprospiraceae bacterium]|nr:T9SS type A sorting domain-containing protein [Saprospiraceae bacterium]